MGSAGRVVAIHARGDGPVVTGPPIDRHGHALRVLVDDGEVLVATQAGSHSGDASRDLAGRILAAVALEPGAPLTTAPPVTADTPRLQDLLAPASDPRAQVHDGFDYWIGDQEAEGAAKNASKADEKPAAEETPAEAETTTEA